MKKKILFISSWFPNKGDQTAGNFVRRHAEAVAEFHDVEILHAAPYEQQKIYVYEASVVNGIRTIIVYYRNTKIAPLNFILRMVAYYKGFLKLQKPDLVHANVLHNNMLFAVFLKYRFSIPFVATEHWTALRRANSDRTPWMTRKIAAFIGNRARTLLPVSQDLALGLQDLGIKRPMLVVPNVVNTKLFHRAAAGRNRAFTFIHLSNLIPRKNPEKILNVALKLFEQGHDFRLEIGGDGDLSALKKILKTSPFAQQIEIFGTQTESEVAQRMRNADCFILFSDDENQPCVIAESFASGIRVISTNVGGISEFFPDGFGILLASVDEQVLADAMLKIIHETRINPEKLASYADQMFSRKAIGQKYSEVYQKILT